MSQHLDPLAKPPSGIKDIYKIFQKGDRQTIENRPDLIDVLRRPDCTECHMKHNLIGQLPKELQLIFSDFLDRHSDGLPELQSLHQASDHVQVFEITSVPGLYIYPSLFPPAVQIKLLEKLFRRDLSNPDHKTNVHMHYDVPYPKSQDRNSTPSYFDASYAAQQFEPKDPNLHRPINTKQYLNKKLRWMTLGGQYDWTRKIYPTGSTPPFPKDIKSLIERIFPMKAEAAIVNLYSPGDTLSLHRDVSEECNQPLVSISLGCDGIFVAGLDGETEHDEPRVATIRLRSGDAVLMSGESRYAWHGVPKILSDTCPSWMQDWPAVHEGDTYDGSSFERWKGWMKGKRINLNVRQMFA